MQIPCRGLLVLTQITDWMELMDALSIIGGAGIYWNGLDGTFLCLG
jgi:hypothetical protein